MRNESVTGIGGRLRQRRLTGVLLWPGALGNSTLARICRRTRDLTCGKVDE